MSSKLCPQDRTRGNGSESCRWSAHDLRSSRAVGSAQDFLRRCHGGRKRRAMHLSSLFLVTSNPIGFARTPATELPAGRSYGSRLDRAVSRSHHDSRPTPWTRMTNATLALLLVLGLAGPAAAAELADAVGGARGGD